MKTIFRKTGQAIKTLSKRRMIVFGSAVLLIVVSATVYASNIMNTYTDTVQIENDITAQETGTGTFNTIEPTLVSGSSSVVLLGTVLSNQTANIYPRRNGIVEDIYVDIGDSVQKGQVVALLLPKGVEGQSAAAIAEKKAKQAQTESDYISAQAVKEETIISARQKISEKETELRIAKSEQESLLEKFAEYESNIDQEREQAFTAVRSARQVIEQIIIGTNSRTGIAIYEEDILTQLGLLNPQTRYDIIPFFDQLASMEKSYLESSDSTKTDQIYQLISTADSALVATLSLLSATPTVPTPRADMFTQDSLGALTTRILTTQSSILKAKEDLQDAKSMYSTLIASEPDLYHAYRSGNLSNAKSNKYKMIESQLLTSQNNLLLTEASQQQMVERQKSMVDIATAQLQSEFAQSGHREIKSPFSGVVSKRFISVGEIVAPAMSAFELTDVPTSLAQKAKTEIQFGLPEQLLTALDTGDTVTFFLQANETKPYSAVVTRKSPQVDIMSHTVTIQAKVSDDLDLPHQASVRIRLTDESTPVFRVPSSAVKRKGDQNYVWIIDEATDAPVSSTVSVIAEEGEFAEITGALTVESKIILDPPDLFISNNNSSR